MSITESEKIRILVFGSPSVGKTSMINMLTNQSKRIYDSSQSRPFEYEDVEYTHTDNKSYIFTDTTGIIERNTFNENTAEKLKTFLEETSDKRYNLLIHVQKQGRILEDSKFDYDLIIKSLFANCKSLCVITFSENNMNWWLQNKQFFVDNKMEYTDGISICSSFEKEEGFDIFKTIRNKSKDELWKFIETNKMPEGVIPYRNLINFNHIRSMAQNVLNDFSNFIFSIKNRRIDSKSEKASKSRNQEYSMLLVYDSNDLSIEFLYGFLKMNAEKNWGSEIDYIPSEKLLGLSTGDFKCEIKFIDINWFKVEKTREHVWKKTFKFLVNPQNSIFNCKLLIKLWREKIGRELDEIFNWIKESFEQDHIKTVEKQISNQYTTIFADIPNLSPIAECQIEFNIKFWDKFCEKQNFLNDVDLSAIEIKIYDCILMCNSTNERNEDYEEKLKNKGWIKIHDTYSDSFPPNKNGYVGVAYSNYSGLIT